MEFLKNSRELGKTEKIFIVILIIALIGAGWFAWYTGNDKASKIDSFEECVAAGNPIMESLPEQCSANGKTFQNEAQLKLPTSE